MRRIYFFALLLTLVVPLWAVNAQSTINVGAISVTLPESWVTLEDENGIFFGDSEASIAIVQSFTGDVYQAVTGAALTAMPMPANTDSYAGAMLIVLNAEIAMQSEMISDALTATEVDRTTVDGRSALYLAQADEDSGMVQMAGIIDDEETIVVMIGTGTIGTISTSEFFDIFSSIRYAAAVPAETETQAETETTVIPLGDVPAFTSLSLADTVDMREVVSPVGTSLSPDGTHLAVFGPDGLCVSELDASGASGSRVCAIGTDMRALMGARLTWSPDSSFIALHEDAVRRLEDSDIWVMNTETGTMNNLTDEGYSGRAFPTSSFEDRGLTSITLDITPAWFGSSVYFFRSEFSSADERPTGFYRIDAVNPGEPELIAEYSTNAEDIMSVFSIADIAMLSGAMAVSPSGRYLAAVRTPANAMQNSEILIVDTGSGAIETLVSITELQAGLPAFVSDPALIGGIGWLGDESAVLVGTHAMGTTPVGNIYQVDLASGTVLPLLMLDTVETQSDMAVGDASPIMLTPYDAQILPDGSAVIWQGLSDGQLAIWTSALPLTESFSPENPPALVSAGESRPFRFRASLGQNGSDVRLLFGANLFLLDRE